MRFTAFTLTLALATACAATPASDDIVFLESESYRCGAAEGLGCGLAIAPVLESIDALDGVAESSVSWDGRYFRIALLPGADASSVATEAAALLEGEACCVAAPRGAAEARPDEWFDLEHTVELSRYEAGVIAADFASQIAAEAALAGPDAEHMEAVLREELEHAFERAHAQGGGVYRLREQLPEVRTGFEGRLGFLTPDQRSRIAALLDQKSEEI